MPKPIVLYLDWDKKLYHAENHIRNNSIIIYNKDDGRKSTSLVITPAKRVMFSSAFVCLLAAKTTQLMFTKFDGKVAHGSRKKRLDFGGNPDHVTLGYGQGYG